MLEEVLTPKGSFEINWPLETNQNELYTYERYIQATHLFICNDFFLLLFPDFFIRILALEKSKWILKIWCISVILPWNLELWQNKILRIVLLLTMKTLNPLIYLTLFLAIGLVGKVSSEPGNQLCYPGALLIQNLIWRLKQFENHR